MTGMPLVDCGFYRVFGVGKGGLYEGKEKRWDEVILVILEFTIYEVRGRT